MADEKYKPYPYQFTSKGIVARFAQDSVPPQSYLSLKNLETRQEGALSTRYGHTPITVIQLDKLPAGVHTLARLKGVQGATYRYAGASNILYRRVGDGEGQYTAITGPILGGLQFSWAAYRPNFSSYPYIFFADEAAMLKDDGVGTQAEKWGILAPTIPAQTELYAPSVATAESFDSLAGFDLSNYTGAVIAPVAGGVIAETVVPGTQTVTPSSMVNVFVGSLLLVGGTEYVIVVATTASTFTAVFSQNHPAGTVFQDNSIRGTIAANTTATISKSEALDFGSLGGTSASDSDIIRIFVSSSVPANVTSLQLLFDVGDGSFTQDYYVRELGPIPSGASVWGAIDSPRGAFTAIGRAGLPGYDWSNINAFRLRVVTAAGGGTTIAFNDLFLLGGGGLDSTGGVGYDYRYTYFNINTGDESAPSMTQIQSLWLFPLQQGIQVSWTASTDPQVTHVRLYRRGGTLATGWNLVAQVPIGQTSIIDTLPDSVIQNATALEIDNFTPITSTLPVPVNTILGTAVPAGKLSFVIPPDMTNIFPSQILTIDTGENQETVYVVSTTANGFSAYFQYAHGLAATVYGEARYDMPVKLCCVAFDRMFFAGDPNNPNRLYYSKIGNPESVPPQNFVEIGTPADPIMNMIEIAGFLYVFTLSTIYRIISFGGSDPLPIKTSSRHGLVANWAITLAEGKVLYLSHDGIYQFAGGDSSEVSAAIQWVFRGERLGPIPPLDPAGRHESTMSFEKNEIFFAYWDVNSTRRRVIFSTRDNRWRDDTTPATAMLFEEDIAQLVFGDSSGFIYRDRVGDQDFSPPVSGPVVDSPIDFELDTGNLDLGAPNNNKVINEIIVDIDTGGQEVEIVLRYNNAQQSISLGNVKTSVRDQVPLAINRGLGIMTRNVGIQVKGQATTGVIHVFSVAFKALLEGMEGLSDDTYWLRFGTDEYKIAKQAWFEYRATATIQVDCYVDGNETAPRFSFLLPTTGGLRKATRVRFPATKAKSFRFVSLTESDFNYYEESHIEVKPANGSPKGYEKASMQV